MINRIDGRSLDHKTNEFIRMNAVARYAPDLNPDEFVWNYLKSEGPSKRPMKIGESLRERIVHILEIVKRTPNLIRSFFKAAELAYI